jgi:hypothetical protein
MTSASPVSAALPNAEPTREENSTVTTISPQHVELALDYIRRYEHVSFIELQRFAEDTLGIPSSGDYALEAAPNLILWAGVSNDFVDLVNAIKATKSVDLNPTSLLVYMVDGGLLNMPIAKRPPRNGYKEPHWAPVVLHLKEAAAA